MLDELDPLSKLQAAVREFQARAERVDTRGLRQVIDVLEGEFSIEARESQEAGEHLAGGHITAASWISQTCGMSVPSAFDRSVSASSWSRCRWLLLPSPGARSASRRRL